MSICQVEDGTDIYFESFGGSAPNKPYMIMLPGLLGAVRSQWRNFVQPLTPEFRIVMIDLRGHGRSKNAANELRAETMMQDIFGVMDHLKIDQAHIIGYSLGGYLGLLMAYHQTRRIKSLVVHGTKFYWTDESVKMMVAQLDPEFMAQKAPTYADLLVQDHGARIWRILVRQAADLIYQLSKNGLNESMLKKVQCPTLVSVGARDELVSLAEAQRLSYMLPKGELIVLPRVRHPISTLLYMPMLPMMQHFCLNA